MNEINNEQIKSILFEVSKEFILPKFKNLKSEEIQFKNNRDLVTEVDLAVEEKLNNILCSLLPNSLFVGEEKFSLNSKIFDCYKQNQYCWTVDPIDGTANFVNGKEKFAIMVALTFSDQIIQSWIYKPLTEEICSALLGEGTFINDEKIIITNNRNISEASGSISSKYWNETFDLKMKEIRPKFKHVKSYGCIGFEYLEIATNIRDFAILSNLSPWDHIPGILIVREAGGFDIHFDKTPYAYNIEKKNLVVSGSITLQNEIINLIKE